MELGLKIMQIRSEDILNPLPKPNIKLNQYFSQLIARSYRSCAFSFFYNKNSMAPKPTKEDYEMAEKVCATNSCSNKPYTGYIYCIVCLFGVPQEASREAIIARAKVKAYQTSKKEDNS
jgi:hypothetical protein